MVNLKFTVDSALLGELGERLVEHVHYALVELVKNAYDADADEVIIKFVEDDRGNNQLQIIDNGIGMNFNEVRDFWMHIATTNKVDKNESLKYGRPKTGSKGIGRFSCRRLGEKLELITTGKKGKKYQRTSAVFNWEDFEPGTDITNIVCAGNEKESNSGETGTTLIISSLIDEWTTARYNYVKRQLAVHAANRGIKRDGFIEDPGFNIKLEALNFEGEIRDLREDVLNAGWGTLKAYINKKHQAVCHLDALGIGRKTIVSNRKFTLLSDISLKLGIIVLKGARNLRDTNVASRGSLTEIAEKWGGVQVHMKGFRVYPYGDDDWLNIDKDRSYRKGKVDEDKYEELFTFAQKLQGVDPGRALLSLLSMNNYLGNVEIGPKASGFVAKANREGFLDSLEFEELREFVRFAIDWSTIYRDFYLRENIKKEAEVSKVEFEEEIGKEIESENVVDAAVNYIESEVKSISTHLPMKQRQLVNKTISKATDAIAKHEQLNKEKISHLRLIASTSTLILVFSHEVKALLGLLESISNRFNLFKKHLPDNQIKIVESIVDQLQGAKLRFKDLLKMTALMGVDSKKDSPKMLSLKERVEQSVKVFDLITHSYEIDINYDDVPNNLLVGPILEAELYSILLNLLSNSIKSVIAAGKRKEINLAAHKKDKAIKVRICDTGVGLDPIADADIFIPFIADQKGKLYSKLDKRLNPEDKFIVGTGSGLGLSIVHEILSAKNGEIIILPPQDHWKAIIEVKIP